MLAKEIFSKIVSEGETPLEGSWCILLIPKALFSSFRLLISIPSNRLDPPSFSSEPLIRLKRVDFPHPFEPKTATNSLSLTVKLKFSNIVDSFSVPKIKLLD